MEENIYDDKMDDYVRKSFEDHEEMPPDDMWSRVEAALPEEERKRPVLWLFHYRWQALAATVIILLMATVVCEHLYYQNRLNVVGVPAIHPESAAERPQQPVSPAILTPEVSKHTAALPDKNNQEYHNKPILHTETNRNIPTNKPAVTAPIVPQQTIKTALHTNPPAPPATTMEVVDRSSTPTVIAAQTQITLDKITLAPDTLATERQWPQPQAVTASINQLTTPQRRSGSGWYAGIQYGTLFAFEPRRQQQQQGTRPFIRDKGNTTQTGNIWWATLGKSSKKALGFETGIGYQRITRKAEHTPNFRFADGAPLGSGGPPWQQPRAYTYELSTYGGTAEVELRMEQSTGSGQPSNDEPVRLRITTEENISMLRVPLLAVKQITSGPLDFKVKFGVTANYILDSQLEFSGRVSQNPRFQLVTQNGYNIRLAQPNRWSLGMMAAASLEYHIGARTSVVAALNSLHDLHRRDASRRKLPKQQAVALNFGANYYF